MDYFTNAMARTGFGTASIPEATEYNLDRLSNDYWLMISMYRNHWIARRIVDLPAVDMTRSWPKMQCDRSPQDLEKFKRKITRTYTPSAIRTALKWARLYGGAGGLITIRGHEDILDEPLDLDDVNPGTFLGIIPFDRWVGIYPVGVVRDDYGHPADWGMPEYYEVRGPDTGESFKIHASRILRFSGPSVPTPELQAQIYWGISILEVVWEELKKRDNASFAILNLLFRANIIAQINPQLEQLLSGVGTNQTALKNFWGRMQAQNEIMSNQSMLILGKDADMKQMQYSFSGMDGLYGMFQMDVAGAAEIPVTRLFGRTVTGLGQSNDADERYYEEMIASRQHEELQPQLDKLYPVVAMSEFGEVPDDMDITFPSVRILTEEEKAELLEKASAPVLAAYNAGLISQKSALKDLRQIGDQTGTAFTNITDEDIDNADDEPVLPGGEELPEGFEQEEGKPAEGEEKKGEEEEEAEAPEKEGPVEQAAKKVGSVNPQRLLRKASGGAEDQKRQGKVVVEHQIGDEYLVMFPDGEIKTIFGKNKVISAAKAWFKKDLGKEPIGVGMIEWRGGGGAEDAIPGWKSPDLNKGEWKEYRTEKAILNLDDLSPLTPKSYLNEDDYKRIKKYAEKMKSGTEFPPIEVVPLRSGKFRIVDGNTRFRAWASLGKKAMPVIIIRGKKRKDSAEDAKVERGWAQPEEAFSRSIVTPKGEVHSSSDHSHLNKVWSSGSVRVIRDQDVLYIDVPEKNKGKYLPTERQVEELAKAGRGKLNIIMEHPGKKNDRGVFGSGVKSYEFKSFGEFQRWLDKQKKGSRDVENLDSESETARNSREQLKQLLQNAIGKRKSSKNRVFGRPIFDDTEFRESDHPRDETGKFSESGSNTGTEPEPSEKKADPKREELQNSLASEKFRKSYKELDRQQRQEIHKQVEAHSEKPLYSERDFHKAIYNWTSGSGRFDKARNKATQAIQSGKVSTNPIAYGIRKRTVKDSIYRGISVGPDSPWLKAEIGTELQLMPQSFTKDLKIADFFSGQGTYQFEEGTARKVILQVESGSHGLDVSRWSSMKTEQEVISAGKFKILNTSESSEGSIVISLRQIGVF